MVLSVTGNGSMHQLISGSEDGTVRLWGNDDTITILMDGYQSLFVYSILFRFQIYERIVKLVL